MRKEGGKVHLWKGVKETDHESKCRNKVSVSGEKKG